MIVFRARAPGTHYDSRQDAKHAKEFKTKAPVVLDSDQKIAKRVDARVTPEAFVINRKGKTVYRGRINDLYEDFGKRRRTPSKHDLKDALDALLAGKKIETPNDHSLKLTEAHIASLRLVLTQDIQGNGGTQGDKLTRRLVSLVEACGR